jgi:hypothetical protein
MGYPRLALLCPLAARIPRKFARSLGRDIHGAFAMEFLQKMGPFGGGGMPPAVAPEGDLVFGGKSSRPFTLLIDEIYICTTN